MRKNKEELYDTKEYKRIVAKSFFIIKPLKWIVQYNLSSTDSDIMGIILAFQRSKDSNGWFGGGVVALQVYLQKSRDTIVKALNSLVERKLIERNKDGCYRVAERAINFEISNISIKNKPKKVIKGANDSNHFALERQYDGEELESILNTNIEDIKV